MPQDNDSEGEVEEILTGYEFSEAGRSIHLGSKDKIAGPAVPIHQSDFQDVSGMRVKEEWTGDL